MAGIGLNVNQTVFRSDAPNPVSLATDHRHRIMTCQPLPESLSDLIDSRYGMIIQGRDDPLSRKIIRRYCTESGDMAPATGIAKGMFEGLIDRVKPDGMLCDTRKKRGDLRVRLQRG
ncbi:MAG: hypothetical protein MZV63_53435 [Marinilabiliales bacterium]|nr:hypothetical protein [Marinilabiliales bacterium]